MGARYVQNLGAILSVPGFGFHFFEEHPGCLRRDHCVSSVPRMKSTTQQVLANLLPNQRTHIPVHSQVPNEATPHLSLAFFKILSLSKNKVFLAAAGT